MKKSQLFILQAMATAEFASLAGDRLPDVSLEARDSDPVYADTFSKLKNHLANEAVRSGVRVSDEELNISLEAYLDTMGMTREVASARMERGSLPADAKVLGNAAVDVKGLFALENFDDTYAAQDSGIINVQYSTTRVAHGDISNVYNIFPVADHGTKRGLVVNVPRQFIRTGLKHTNGSVSKFQDIGLENVLDSDYDFGSLRIYPDVDNGNADLLVDPAVIEPWTVATLHDETHKTVPFRFGVEVDVIGAALSASRMERGGFNRTDELDRTVHLDEIFVNFGDEIVSFDVNSSSTALFDPSVQGSDNELTLTSNIDVLMTASTETTAGVPVTKITIPADHRVSLKMRLSGYGNIVTGTFGVNLNSIVVDKIINAEGQVIPDDDALYTDMQAEVDAWKDAAPETFGYTLDARLQNANLRELGYLVENEVQVEAFPTRRGMPISQIRPVNRADIPNVINHLHSQSELFVARDIINTLVTAERRLSLITDKGTLSPTVAPSTFGAGRHALNTVYDYSVIDMQEDINSISHKDRDADRAGLVIPQLNDAAANIYNKGGYPQAELGLPLDQSRTPIMVITSSPQICNMLKRNKAMLDSKFNWKFNPIPSRVFDNKINLVINYTTKGYHLLNFGVTTKGTANVFNTVHPVATTGIKHAYTVHPTKTPHVNAPVMATIELLNVHTSFGKVCVSQCA